MEPIVKRQVCQCENCGNEAEMVVTCSLPEHTPEAAETQSSTPSSAAPARKVKGQATCTQCGNEADMWVDL